MGLCVHEFLRIFYIQNHVICEEFYFFSNLDVFYFLFFPSCFSSISFLNIFFLLKIFNPSFKWLPVPDSLRRESPALGPPPDKLVLKDAGASPLEGRSTLRPGGYQHHHHRGPTLHPKLRTLGFRTHLVTNPILTTFHKIPG